MKTTGRLPQLLLELFVACAACLALALLTPLSFWGALGEAGSAFFILSIAAGLAGVVIWRSICRDTASKPAHPAGFESLE